MVNVGLLNISHMVERKCQIDLNRRMLDRRPNQTPIIVRVYGSLFILLMPAALF